MSKRVKCFDEFLNESEEVEVVVAKDIDHLNQLIADGIEKFGNEADLNYIDVSNITDMSYVFSKLLGFFEFNGDISKWNTSNVTDMRYMFSGSEFNGDISKWNTSNVTDMYRMFKESVFNQDISKWNVSKVTDMSMMFLNSEFNGDISKWEIGSVTDMHRMFKGSKFNGDISKWEIGSVTNMSDMFKGSKFNGDISNWQILLSDECDISAMFQECDIRYCYKPIRVLEEEFKDNQIESKKEIVSAIKEAPEEMQDLLTKIPKSEAKLYNYIETMLRIYYNERDDFDTVSDLNDIGF